MGQDDEAELKIKLFGRFEVWKKGECISPESWPQRKTETLLKILLTERGRIFTQDQLIEALFPELGLEKAAQNLYKRISELRHTLESDLKKGADSQYVLRAGQGGYCFSEKISCWLDTEQFQKSCETARELASTDRWSQALEHYQQAIELYRGDYLAEDLYEEWSLAPREQWREHYLQALSQLIECHARLEQYQEAIESCQRMIALEPSRESAYRAKMLYHYYAGEQPKALQTYEECVKAIKEELDVDPAEETKALHQLILQGKVPPLPQAIPNNLPQQLTPLIGREDELAEIGRHLEDPSCRLLTLVGPGGIGKTRLALEAATEILEQFPNGVFFIPLAPVSTPALLVFTIAEALKFSFYGREDPKQQFLEFLHEKKMLLVLDNFEHLLEGAELVSEILQSAPQVRFLITSRERLKLQGERLLEIEGLKVPPSEKSVGAERYSAVQLFLQNARRVSPKFALTKQEAPYVVRICRLVDGMPLGIELATVWVHVFSCKEIAEEIQRNVDFLATRLGDMPERHRSMRAVFDYSWNLLTREEKECFPKVSVFRGGFRREAAMNVTGASLALLASLLDKYLVRRIPSGRYEVHELLRQYAHEGLRERPPELEEAQGLHCAYYSTYLHQREVDLRGARQKEALEEIGEEIENVRLAWGWAIEHRKSKEIGESLESLYLFYEMRSWLQEGEEVFGKAIERLRVVGIDSTESIMRINLGRILGFQGWFSHRLGRYEQARGLAQESVGILRGLGAGKEMAFSTIILGAVADAMGNYAEARQLYEESLRLCRENSYSSGAAITLNNLGMIAWQQGEYQESKRLYEESLILYKGLGDKRGFAGPLDHLGEVLACMGEYPQSRQMFQESLAIYRELDNRRGIARLLNNLGELAYQLGDYPEAKRLHQESLALRKEIGDRRGIATSLNNLGEVAFSLKEYAEAKELLEQSITIKREISNRWGIAISLNYLGVIAAASGDLREAKRLCQESLALRRDLRDRRGMAQSLKDLGEISCALGERLESKGYFNEALRIAGEMQAAPLVVEVVVGIAALRAKSKEIAQAVELLAFALPHPASVKSTQEKAKDLLTELEAQLLPQVAAAAKKRGKARRLEDVVDEILRESQTEAASED